MKCTVRGCSQVALYKSAEESGKAYCSLHRSRAVAECVEWVLATDRDYTLMARKAEEYRGWRWFNLDKGVAKKVASHALVLLHGESTLRRGVVRS